MFVLNGPPDAFNLPARPRLPRLNILPAAAATIVAAAGYCLAAAFSFRRPSYAARIFRINRLPALRYFITGYYDVPVIHGPHWKWLSSGYFYFGGISGGFLP